MNAGPKLMGMFLQDPSIKGLLENYSFSLANDYHEGMGSRKLIVRDEDLEGRPLNAGLEWSEYDKLSYEFFVEFAFPPVDNTLAPLHDLPNGKTFEISRLTDNPQFRQVNVFAVVANALDFVERELGGEIQWQNGEPLVLRPHAFEGDSAHFSAADNSLNFGFYREGSFPNYMIWRCLNHDTVVHELGHAVLYHLRPWFDLSNHSDTNALHEAFGTMLAIFATLRNEKVVAKLKEQIGEDLRLNSLVTDLFERFGNRYLAFIRSLLTKPIYDPRTPADPHDRAEIWTGALYEILVRFEQEAGRRDSKLKFEERVTEATKWLRGMVLRTLSYLPPTKITMPLWATIIYEADALVFKNDSALRDIARDVFREQKIWDDKITLVPPNANKFTGLLEVAIKTDTLHQWVFANAGPLGIPLGQGIALRTPILTKTTRKADKHDVSGKPTPLDITEYYLQYTFKIPGYYGYEYQGGTLVLNEKLDPVIWATDPIRKK